MKKINTPTITLPLRAANLNLPAIILNLATIIQNLPTVILNLFQDLLQIKLLLPLHKILTIVRMTGNCYQFTRLRVKPAMTRKP